MRIDTTVVETNIHYPTDSSLLGDGVRVFDPRDEAGRRHRGRYRGQTADRSRSVKYRILEIGRAARNKGGAGKETLYKVTKNY